MAVESKVNCQAALDLTLISSQVDRSIGPTVVGADRCQLSAVWSCGHLHKSLVVVANLLNVHAELGIDVGLDGAITMRIVASAADKSRGILQGALVLQPSGGHAAMAMSSLQHAGELRELELQ